MRAVVIRNHGGPEALSYEEIPNPEPRDGHAIVKVRYCAVNHLDIWVRNGIAGKPIVFPHVLGCDIMGTLLKGFGGFKRGEKVVVYPAVEPNLPRVSFSILGGFSRYDGGYAELVQVPKKNIIKKPSWLGDAEACALNVSYLTAWNMLQKAACKRGDAVLIWGASGGVGSASIMLARALGLKVIAVASTKEKAERARKIGAHFVIDRTKDDVTMEVLKHTSDIGVDAVIDHVGAKTWRDSIEVLMVGGRLVTCGTTSGPEATIDIRALYSKQAAILGAYLGSREQLIALHKFMKMKKIRPIIDSVFDLKDARSAHNRMEEGSQFGKIILKVSS